MHDLVAQADMIVLQYEIRPETLLVAIDLAVEYGKPVMFNLALAHPIDLSFLVKIIFLVVYEVEAEFLAGFPVESEEPARRAAVALQQLGPATVIITLGVQGALISTRTEQALIPAFKVTPVDSTAAGDIFCGSLAVALVESQSVMDSVRFASAAAAISVTRLGAQPSAPSREEIDRFLAQAV